ncbi:hypothetical protein BT96DRAFT_219930 [Gymnopus androsaceus JB14]|uniref:F-box domain-containing protein n=1 Tax=Gymnopus androsaceus JB14 TaxID=1447944 RepID=A0A6A4IB16_9AGAR|nr:hypothetical protein BT96DRAFT_219930 [Gymnopus androsaceus JB14]
MDLILSSFTCPSLTSLTLEGRSISSTPRMFHSLETFLTRSSCALTSLSIYGLQPTGDALIVIAKQLPSLTSLTIDDLAHSYHCTITPAFIQSLHNTFCLSSTPLLPKLHYLSLRYAGWDFDDAGFVGMIQSRCLSESDARRIGIEPLQSLVLKSYARTPTSFGEVAEIYEPLRRLKEAGFRLIVEGVLE